jgi:hypothetical protein
MGLSFPYLHQGWFHFPSSLSCCCCCLLANPSQPSVLSWKPLLKNPRCGNGYHKAWMVNLVNHEELLAFCGSIGASQWDLHIWATAKTWPPPGPSASTEEAEGDESTEKYEPLGGPRAHRQRQVGLRPEFSGAIPSGKL